MSLKDLILNLLLLLCVSTELKRMQQYAGTASCLYYTSLHSDSHSLISVLKFDLKRSWDGFFLLLFEYVPWGLLIMLIKFFAQKYVEKWLFSTLILNFSQKQAVFNGRVL